MRMMLSAGGVRLGAGLVALAQFCALLAASSPLSGIDFIVTGAPIYEPLAALRGQERFPKGAQLLLVHLGKAEPLLPDFAASADASISFDGLRILFAGKKAAADVWQVWELTLADRSSRRLTFSAADSIRPLYLPSGRFAFAERTGKGFQLQVAPLPQPEGASRSVADAVPTPLTFAGANAIPSDVLADGRILFESDFPLGSGSLPEMFLVYSDGSGVEAYRCDHGVPRWGGKQLASGDVVFTHGASLGRFTSSLAHEERIAAPQAEYAGGIAEMPSAAWLMSARIAKSGHYGINVWQPGAASLEPILARGNEDLVEPVLLAPRNRPKRHPSGLHPWDYANLMALDARLSRDGILRGSPATVRLETLGSDGRATLLGTAPVESDGSFFVKVPGDKPLRFALLDEKGAILRREHGWFWARGGEQRYCVGCHAGPERAPDNKVPAVLLRSTTPIDLTRIGGTQSVSAAPSGGR
jgi:hypothetical protein